MGSKKILLCSLNLPTPKGFPCPVKLTKTNNYSTIKIPSNSNKLKFKGFRELSGRKIVISNKQLQVR